MHTLLLNASHEVLKIVNWKRAVRLTLFEKAEVIAHYSDKTIKTPNATFNVPSVIRLKKMVKPYKRFGQVKFSKINLYIRDNYKCQYCDKKFKYSELTIDHIIPRSRGGESTWTNCVTCCYKCNIFKADKNLKNSGLQLMSIPRPPRYSDLLKQSILYRTNDIPDIWKEILEQR